ncbi:response regulator [Hymenobacter sp. ASUV-10]|uniref:Response regulator n=1 Tax=Hymenobacter aranciens TaxID=3063996 RepID=A0ABT9BF98_9BACT|nr:response regulator [Hymenobacter sp. ASUV-10]MDO7876931.1 response regulator [Hymenobacter sp. ASUV-10]
MQKLSSVLLVDDDPTTNYLNRKLLERLAVTDVIEVAQDGQQALSLLLDRCRQAAPVATPALLLLDVKMPVMDGFEFLAAYEQLPLDCQQRVVIVVLTTSLHPQDVQRMEQLPIAGFLSKPLTQEKISQVIQEHFPAPAAN